MAVEKSVREEVILRARKAFPLSHKNLIRFLQQYKDGTINETEFTKILYDYLLWEFYKGEDSEKLATFEENLIRGYRVLLQIVPGPIHDILDRGDHFEIFYVPKGTNARKISVEKKFFRDRLMKFFQEEFKERFKDAIF